MKKLFGLIVLIGIGSYIWYSHALSAVSAKDASRRAINIAPGSSVNAIASLLQKEGFIRSPLAFKISTKLNGVQSELQAGRFVLQPSFSTAEIIDVLRTGKGEEMSVTIPEGYTVKEIDALMVRSGLTETGTVLNCAQNCDFATFEFLPTVAGLAPRGGKLEGYLYADTYFVNVSDFNAKFFLERLLGTMRAKVIKEMADDIKASGRSLHEILTMASLIEEEAITDAERPVIAGILWKRYDVDMGLGVDATVRYILDKPSADITIGDLNSNSPYNTRKFKGLPPGPIASPGIKSIEAALHPQDSAYWYYLHDPRGQIHYSETNEEHNIKRYNLLH